MKPEIVRPMQREPGEAVAFYLLDQPFRGFKGEAGSPVPSGGDLAVRWGCRRHQMFQVDSGLDRQMIRSDPRQRRIMHFDAGNQIMRASQNPVQSEQGKARRKAWQGRGEGAEPRMQILERGTPSQPPLVEV